MKKVVAKLCDAGPGRAEKWLAVVSSAPGLIDFRRVYQSEAAANAGLAEYLQGKE